MVGRSLVDIQRHLQEAAERETDAGRMVAKLADAVAEELTAQGDALAEELQEREEVSARKISELEFEVERWKRWEVRAEKKQRKTDQR